MRLLPSNSLFKFNDLLENFHPNVDEDSTETGFFSPRVDVIEKNDGYEIRADFPGIEKKNLSVTLQDGILTIEAISNHNKLGKHDGRILRKERRSGKYLRSFNLGKNVSGEDIIATFENGVLIVQAAKVTSEDAEINKIAIH